MENLIFSLSPAPNMFTPKFKVPKDPTLSQPIANNTQLEKLIKKRYQHRSSPSSTCKSEQQFRSNEQPLPPQINYHDHGQLHGGEQAPPCR